MQNDTLEVRTGFWKPRAGRDPTHSLISRGLSVVPNYVENRAGTCQIDLFSLRPSGANQQCNYLLRSVL